MSNDPEIDSIIDQLKNDAVPSISLPKQTEIVKTEPLTDANVGDYVYEKSAQLVDSTLNAIENIKDNILTGTDPKELAALSQLINSATKALDQLNKINIQNKQNKNNIEIKKMEIESNVNNPPPPPTTNIMIATREQVMAQLFDKSTKKLPSSEVIEGDFEKS